MNRKIALIGANGMLGTEFMYKFQAEQTTVVPLTDRDIDITDYKYTLEVLTQIKPEIIINCAAYTAVDQAEQDIEMAFKVNALGVKHLAQSADKLHCHLVHYSTDYVFPGANADGYLEDAETAPINQYGASKLQGEQELANILAPQQYIIMRTAWLYGNLGKNFVRTMLRLADTMDVVKVVNDQIGSPTHTKDLVQWTTDLLKLSAYGMFHSVNSGSGSWYDFAKKIFNLAGKKVETVAVTSREFPTPAKRPAFSLLINKKLEKALNYPIKKWPEALSEYLNSMTL